MMIFYAEMIPFLPAHFQLKVTWCLRKNFHFVLLQQTYVVNFCKRGEVKVWQEGTPREQFLFSSSYLIVCIICPLCLLLPLFYYCVVGTHTSSFLEVEVKHELRLLCGHFYIKSWLQFRLQVFQLLTTPNWQEQLVLLYIIRICETVYERTLSFQRSLRCSWVSGSFPSVIIVIKCLVWLELFSRMKEESRRVCPINF